MINRASLRLTHGTERAVGVALTRPTSGDAETRSYTLVASSRTLPPFTHLRSG